LKLTRSP